MEIEPSGKHFKVTSFTQDEYELLRKAAKRRIEDAAIGVDLLKTTQVRALVEFLSVTSPTQITPHVIDLKDMPVYCDSLDTIQRDLDTNKMEVVGRLKQRFEEEITVQSVFGDVPVTDEREYQ